MSAGWENEELREIVRHKSPFGVSQNTAPTFMVEVFFVFFVFFNREDKLQEIRAVKGDCKLVSWKTESQAIKAFV